MIVGFLEDCGWYQSGAYGPVPIDWKYIQCWSEMTGIRVTPDEARLMIRESKIKLSTENISGWIGAEQPLKPGYIETPEEATARLKAKARGYV